MLIGKVIMKETIEVVWSILPQADNSTGGRANSPTRILFF